MLIEIVYNINNGAKNTQEYEKRLCKLNVKFVVSSNQGENEGTQTTKSTELAINKKDKDNFFSKEQVSKNLFKALNFLEKRNSDENKGMLDVEECV